MWGIFSNLDGGLIVTEHLNIHQNFQFYASFFNIAIHMIRFVLDRCQCERVSTFGLIVLDRGRHALVSARQAPVLALTQAEYQTRGFCRGIVLLAVCCRSLTRFSLHTIMSSSASELPIIEGADPATFPLDSFKVAIADLLSKSLDLSLDTAFSGVDFGKKGVDFTVAVPRFRLKSKLPELIEKVTSTVCHVSFMPSMCLTPRQRIVSVHPKPISRAMCRGITFRPLLCPHDHPF